MKPIWRWCIELRYVMPGNLTPEAFLKFLQTHAFHVRSSIGQQSQKNDNHASVKCRFSGRLQLGIAQALQSTPEFASAFKADAKEWRPVWWENNINNEDGDIYTIRTQNGKRHVIKRPRYSVKR